MYLYHHRLQGVRKHIHYYYCNSEVSFKTPFKCIHSKLTWPSRSDMTYIKTLGWDDPAPTLLTIDWGDDTITSAGSSATNYTLGGLYVDNGPYGCIW